MCFQRKMKSELKLSFKHLFELVTQFSNFNVGIVIAIQKKFVWLLEMGEQIKKMTFVNAIAVSLFLFQLSFACNSALYFNMGKKLWRHMSFSSTCFCYYMKHPNNNNKICPLRSSACFQQRFHD